MTTRPEYKEDERGIRWTLEDGSEGEPKPSLREAMDDYDQDQVRRTQDAIPKPPKREEAEQETDSNGSESGTGVVEGFGSGNANETTGQGDLDPEVQDSTEE